MKKGSRKTLVASCLCGLAMLAQGSVSWATMVMTEAQVDTITIDSSLGITFGSIVSAANGQIRSNGTVVATDSAAGAGSFATVTDGSSGLFTSYFNGAGNQAAFLGTSIVAAPSSPTSNPLSDDFVVLGNSVASSVGGGTVTASDTAFYQQIFTINGSGSGTLNLSAFGLYNATLVPDGMFPFSAQSNAFIDFILTGANGLNMSYHVDLTNNNPSNMIGLDIPLLGSFAPDGTPTAGDLFGAIAVNGGEQYTLSITAGSLSEVSSVPEPSSFLLVGAGITGFFFYRRRKTA